MSSINHRKEVLAEVERLGVNEAIDAAENLVKKVRREATARGHNGEPRNGNGSTMRLGDLLAQIRDVKVAAPAGSSSSALSDLELRALAKGLHGWLGPILKDIETRLAAVEATALSDAGVWKPQKVFKPNQITTYRGAAWVCREANSNVRPGTSDHWRLLHKTVGGGRD